MKKKNILILCIGLISIAIILPFTFRIYWGWKESNSIQRGLGEAREHGCLNCHLPVGAKEIKNPNSRLGTVPAFYGGNLMMYISEKSQIKEYILYGHLKGKELPASQLIKMPAFENQLSQSEIEDLAIFVAAANNYDVPNQGEIADGFDIAFEYGCFSCHGIAGSGGMNNPGSLKGYIPGWLGPDFDELVKNDSELDEWIRKGYIERFQNNMLARFFLAHQTIKMPAYDKALTPLQLRNLKTYLRWQRSAISKSS